MNETKEHILISSLKLFLQKSYKEVTMREIVEITGLSKGAFYHHFSSKEELFKDIARMFFSMGVIDYSSFDQGSLYSFYNHYVKYIGESFKEMYRLLGDSVDVSFNFFLIMFEAVAKFPEFLKMELAQHEKSIEAWEQVIQSADEKGEIKSTSTNNHIAALFLYCTDGVFLRFVNNQKKSTYEADLKVAF
ncbi:MAG: TetR/AcrR family transcriptional regulator, partial [Lentisphaerae bacterium]|nr:TetR/AcrR family transcriptional regulator [Lentisphaerota bacterium]